MVWLAGFGEEFGVPTTPAQLAVIIVTAKTNAHFAIRHKIAPICLAEIR